MTSHKQSSRSRDYERELETDKSDFDCPERALWYNVIMQAVTDAMKIRSKDKYKRRDAQAAIDWLRGNSDDFRQVCLLADIDPDYLVMKLDMFFENRFLLRDDGSFRRLLIET